MLEKYQKLTDPNIAPVPKTAMPELRQVSPAEEKLRKAISRFEKSWQQHRGYPREVSKWGDCNIGPDMIGHVVEDEARRHGFAAKSKRHQLNRVHEAAGGSIDHAFQHVFNTVVIDGESFLVDTTFTQFLGDNGLIGWGPKEYYEKNNSGVSNDNYLATALKTDGYVPLTSENFQEYLRITTESPDRSYVAEAQPSVLVHLPEPSPEFSHADANERGYKLLPPSPDVLK